MRYKFPRNYKVLLLVAYLSAFIYFCHRIVTNGKIVEKKVIKQIVLHKTHKCASSTVVNILERFALKHKLKVAVPLGLQSTFFGNKFKFFTSSSVHEVSTAPFDMLYFHFRFNKTEIFKIMKKETIYVTILRDPVAQFDSAFKFFNLYYILGLKAKNGLETFINNPHQFYKSHNNNFLRNPMAFEFGFDSRKNYTKEQVDVFVRETLSSFDLIMISNYFDESLVLFKQVTGWNISDLIYFRLNQQPVTPSLERLRSKITEWNDVDTALYSAALSLFKKKLSRLNIDQFLTDLISLRGKSEEMYKKCVLTRTMNKSLLTENTESWNGKTYGYSLTQFGQKNNLCKQMAMTDYGILLSYRRKFI
ncbi:galactosylceramide sulfotransferase-like [Octopus sinensis]|uniref:Galactosylceramide sulfotransferase-like n=1 Tax=Octopus sinensis TaxID=2607531 RepID=A0A6P7U3D5_9MOLL|nr:galactosylceramide sulfotransferase-like [Octopus sinensis]